MVIDVEAYISRGLKYWRLGLSVDLSARLWGDPSRRDPD